MFAAGGLRRGSHFAHGAVYTFGAYASSPLSTSIAHLFYIQLGYGRVVAFPGMYCCDGGVGANLVGQNKLAN